MSWVHIFPRCVSKEEWEFYESNMPVALLLVLLDCPRSKGAYDCEKM